MATIQEFYTTAARRDFARLFQFRLAAFANIEFKPAHYAYVESASLPGRSITNVPVPYMGLSFNLPGTVTYPGSTGYQVTFRCDANYDLRAALEAATFNTFDEATSTGEYGLPGDDRILQLELLDKKVDKPVRIYTLYGVYVQSLADTAYTVTDTGSVATIQATLAYQFWRAGKVVQSYTTRNPDGLVNNVGAIIPRPF
jgi:hypothetical protein